MQAIHHISYNHKSNKSYIICIKKKKLLKSIQQYNELNKVMKQNGFYIENSKTHDPHRLLLNHTDKINLKRSDKYVALLDLNIYYT